MSYIKECEEYILNVFKSCGYDISEVILEVSSREDLGEFQVNTCMSLAKKYGKNPRVIAEEITKLSIKLKLLVLDLLISLLKKILLQVF